MTRTHAHGSARVPRLRFAALIAALLVVSLGPAGGSDARRATVRAFAGANGKIVYTEEINGGSELVAVNPDGSGKTRLTPEQPASGEFIRNDEASWCGDGSKLAWQRTAKTQEVWMANADGSGKVQLTHNAYDPGEPTFSPDCTRVAYMSGFELWIVPAADGAQATRLVRSEDTLNNETFYSPAWSPDGSMIAYNNKRGGGGDIRILSASDGHLIRNVTQTPNCDEVRPAWSPDGTKIAYQASGTDCPSGPSGEASIYITNADGSGTPTRLVGDGKIDGDMHYPAWSPDGTRIAFVFDGGYIYTASANGGHVTQLTTDSAADYGHPDWQPTASAPVSTVGKTIKGTAANNHITGTPGNDIIYAGAGNDTINGNGGNDRIYGGTGNDHISGGLGINTAYGGPGNDVIALGDDDGEDGSGTCCRGKAYGGPGNDTITGDLGPDLLDGGAGRDHLNGGPGVDTINGGPGNDVISQGEQAECDPEDKDCVGGTCCYGRLLGGAGNDTITGGPEAELIKGGPGINTIRGGPGNDKIVIGSNKECDPEQCTCVGGCCCAGRAFGGAGNDAITGDVRSNLLSGGAGDDKLAGGRGGDTLIGGPGTDTLLGGPNRDRLFAKDGQQDMLNGGPGRDIAVVDKGLDVLAGVERTPPQARLARTCPRARHRARARTSRWTWAARRGPFQQ